MLFPEAAFDSAADPAVASFLFLNWPKTLPAAPAHG